MLKNGDVVFFKKFRRSTKGNAVGGIFKGYGWGVFLGHIGPKEKDPSVKSLFRAFGSIGLVKFDDIGEFLGEEKAAECVKKFEEKYYPPIEIKKKEVVEDKQMSVPPELIPPTPQLIGLDGKPLVK